MCYLQVTFLYNLTDGACPKSYGVNVARLAGLPDEVVRRATSFAAQLEDQHQSAQQQFSLPLNAAEHQKLHRLCHAVEQNYIGPELLA